MFPGNTLDHQTLRTAMKNTVNTLGLQRFILIADRGIYNGPNICHVLKQGNGYIISKSLKKSTTRDRAWALTQDGYTVVSPDFRYKSRIVTRTVTDENGERFLVEVQRSEQHDFYDRAIFNSTFSIQRQLGEGSRRFGFPPVYFIGIMRFSLHPGADRYLYRYSVTEDETGELMTDDLHYIFLEVGKCRGDAGAPLIERVGYALYNLPELQSKPEGYDEEIFDLLFSSADLNKFAPADKIKYQNDMTTERDIQNQIDFAMDKGLEKGRAEGLERGLAKGREEGRKEGREEERSKNQRFIEVLKRKGVPRELIEEALSES